MIATVMRPSHLLTIALAAMAAACAAPAQDPAAPCRSAGVIPEGESLSVEVQTRAREARCRKEAEQSGSDGG